MLKFWNQIPDEGVSPLLQSVSAQRNIQPTFVDYSFAVYWIPCEEYSVMATQILSGPTLVGVDGVWLTIDGNALFLGLDFQIIEEGFNGESQLLTTHLNLSRLDGIVSIGVLV